MPAVVDAYENHTYSIFSLIIFQVGVLVSKTFICITARVLPDTEVAISKQIWPAQVFLAMESAILCLLPGVEHHGMLLSCFFATVSALSEV